MKKRILFFTLLLIAGICKAQEEELVIPPDRPGNTWGAEVMHLHKVSWENGFSFERDAEQRTITLTSTIVRYGIFENVELRVGTDILLQERQDPVYKTIGFSPVTVGTKIKCYESESWLPSVGVLAQLQSPHLGSTELLPSHLAPSLYLLFENSITDWFYVCYNAGAEWDGETATPTTFLSLCLGFDIKDDLGTFVETYNYLHPDGNQYLTEFGLYFQPSPRVQLDFSADLDFQNLRDYFSIGFGVSWMIN